MLVRGNDRVLTIREPTNVDNGDYVCQSGKHRVMLNLNENLFNGGITPHMYSSEDDKYTTVDEGPFRVLNIKELSRQDSGNYFCQSERKACNIG